MSSSHLTKGWMDSTHFMEWMDHFIHKLEKEEGLSQSRRHLIVFDGYKSHMNLDVLAKDHGIDMLSLPSHTSHELQPLDKTCFRPFKVAFTAYRDLWNIKRSGQKCRKENLAQWASLALQKALTPRNILNGFRASGIWPLNPQALIPNRRPCQPFYDEEIEREQKDDILQGNLPAAQEDAIHY